MCPSMHLAQGFKVTEKTESSGALEQLALLDVCTSVESRYMLVLWVLQSFPGSVAAVQGARSGFCPYLCSCHPHTLLSFSVKAMVQGVLGTQRGFAVFGWKGGDVWAVFDVGDVFAVHSLVCSSFPLSRWLREGCGSSAAGT